MAVLGKKITSGHVCHTAIMACKAPTNAFKTWFCLSCKLEVKVNKLLQNVYPSLVIKHYEAFKNSCIIHSFKIAFKDCSRPFYQCR